MVAIALYPFQRVVMAPRDLAQQVNEWVNAANLIRSENEVPCSASASSWRRSPRTLAQVAAENASCAGCWASPTHAPQQAVVVEVLYEPPNSFQQRLVFNKGSRAGLARRHARHRRGRRGGPAGAGDAHDGRGRAAHRRPRLHPVQVLRNGLRLIAFGANTPGEIEIRYLAANADIREGDTIITSGVGGLFPAGLPVAKVTAVERDSASGFARALAEPLAQPERYRHFLVLQVDVASRPSPASRRSRSMGKSKSPASEVQAALHPPRRLGVLNVQRPSGAGRCRLTGMLIWGSLLGVAGVVAAVALVAARASTCWRW